MGELKKGKLALSCGVYEFLRVPKPGKRASWQKFGRNREEIATRYHIDGALLDRLVELGTDGSADVEYESEQGKIKYIRLPGSSWTGPESSRTHAHRDSQVTASKKRRAGGSGKNKAEPGQRAPAGEFHNPYTFVPTPPRPVEKLKEYVDKAGYAIAFAGDYDPLKAGLVHDELKPNLWTGRIPVKMTVVTPLLFPDPDSAEQHGPNPDHFKYKMKPHQPLSSVRGMLRSAYETVTNSRYGVLGEHRDRLGLRLQSRGAPELVPARIEQGTDGKLRARLLTGFAEKIGPNGPEGHSQGSTAQYAAWLPQYERRGRPKDKGRINVLRSKSWADVNHEQLVWATVHLRQHQVWRGNTRNWRRNDDPRAGPWENDFQFWKVDGIFHSQTDADANLAQTPRKAAEAPKPEFEQLCRPDPKTASHAIDANRKVIKGWVCITGPNISNKHDERIFFPAGSGMTCEIEKPIKDAYENLIRDYWREHEKDRVQRNKDGNEMSEYLGPNPGKTAFSRHVCNAEAKRLDDGDLVYARLTFAGKQPEIEKLYPVSISRDLYEFAPIKFLDSSLKPAKLLEDLSPADRLFGWVRQGKGKGAAAYAGRLSFVPGNIISPDGGHIEQLNPELPLAILGAPKPAQGRFYVGKKREHGLPVAQDAGGTKAERGYHDPETQALRGRKAYWHHRGREYTNAQAYWDNGNDQRKEYRKYGESSGQNRSVSEWIKPDTVYRFELDVTNITDEELGALLWLLSLPERHYYRLGYGRPLGFGSVRLELDVDNGNNLPLGKREHWKKYYLNWNAEPPAACTPQEQENARNVFAKAMADAYTQFVNGGEADFERFETLPFVAAFLRVLQGPAEDLPIHYPRVFQKLPDDPKNYEWFVENERGGKLALPNAVPDLDEEAGLPHRPVQRRKGN